MILTGLSHLRFSLSLASIFLAVALVCFGCHMGDVPSSVEPRLQEDCENTVKGCIVCNAIDPSVHWHEKLSALETLGLIDESQRLLSETNFATITKLHASIVAKYPGKWIGICGNRLYVENDYQAIMLKLMRFHPNGIWHIERVSEAISTSLEENEHSYDPK